MTTTPPFYDSAAPRRPILGELQNAWTNRGLIRLLVTRDLTVRYKRSVLGAWWTLLNPMLTVLVFWAVFSQLFDRQAGDVPYIVYITSGILFVTFFSQGVVASGSSIVSSKAILQKVHVPPEVFAFATAIAAAVNFGFSVVALIFVQLITGVGVPWSFLLTPVSIVAMLMFVAGAGMIVASVAVLFYDVFDLVRVLTLLVMYASATFYPIEIVPERFLPIINLNPVLHHLNVFRSFAYGAELSTVSLGVTLLSGILMLALGVWVFSKSWKNVVAML